MLDGSNVDLPRHLIEVKNLWDHIHEVKEEARYEGMQESESGMR